MALLQLGRTKSVAKRSKKYLEEALYTKLFKEGGSEVTVRHQLNQFIKTRKRVYKWEVGDTLRKLRQRKLYYPALKVPIQLLFICLSLFNQIYPFLPFDFAI
jgi:hypothetical protein